MEFHSAVRLWAERAVDSGVLTIADLRNGSREACTLPTRGHPPTPLPDTGATNPTLGRALLRTIRRPVTVHIPVTPEGVVQLLQLGWLDVGQCQRPASVADAVVDIVNGALGARLQPG